MSPPDYNAVPIGPFYIATTTGEMGPYDARDIDYMVASGKLTKRNKISDAGLRRGILSKRYSKP